MEIIHNAIQTDEKYLLTIKKLRSGNFKKNLPFLILSGELPEGQVYREYPDGHVELQEVFSVGPKFEYRVLKTLPLREADKVRIANGLF
jgi:hypothetical protein